MRGRSFRIKKQSSGAVLPHPPGMRNTHRVRCSDPPTQYFLRAVAATFRAVRVRCRPTPPGRSVPPTKFPRHGPRRSPKFSRCPRRNKSPSDLVKTTHDPPPPDKSQKSAQEQS